MTSAAAAVVQTPDTGGVTVEAAFAMRAWARAVLWQHGEYESERNPLAAAVDVLQADAEKSGLVDAIGQDSVRVIIAEAFAAVRDELDPAPPKNGVPRGDSVSEQFEPRKTDAAQSTIAAAEYLIQQNDPLRLTAWLNQHTPAECAAILKHFEGA